MWKILPSQIVVVVVAENLRIFETNGTVIQKFLAVFEL